MIQHRRAKFGMPRRHAFDGVVMPVAQLQETRTVAGGEIEQGGDNGFAQGFAQGVIERRPATRCRGRRSVAIPGNPPPRARSAPIPAAVRGRSGGCTSAPETHPPFRRLDRRACSGRGRTSRPMRVGSEINRESPAAADRRSAGSGRRSTTASRSMGSRQSGSCQGALTALIGPKPFSRIGNGRKSA
jgi:hypothetical protein